MGRLVNLTEKVLAETQSIFRDCEPIITSLQSFVIGKVETIAVNYCVCAIVWWNQLKFWYIFEQCSGSVTFYSSTDPDADPDPQIPGSSYRWLTDPDPDFSSVTIPLRSLVDGRIRRILTNKLRIRMRIQEAKKNTDPDHCFWGSKDRAVNWMSYFLVNLFSFETYEKIGTCFCFNHSIYVGSIDEKFLNVPYRYCIQWTLLCKFRLNERVKHGKDTIWSYILTIPQCFESVLIWAWIRIQHLPVPVPQCGSGSGPENQIN